MKPEYRLDGLAELPREYLGVEEFFKDAISPLLVPCLANGSLQTVFKTAFEGFVNISLCTKHDH